MNNLILTLKAHHSDVQIHKHSACQLVFTDDNPFSSTIENKRHENIFGFVIKPQVAHACECTNSNLFVINIETYSFLGNYITKKLGEARSAVFYDNSTFKAFCNIGKNDFSYLDIFKINQDSLGDFMDKRIIQSIEYIHQNFSAENFSFIDLATSVFLSPSRLTGLFKEQTGSSISKFLLWTRLRNAIWLILLKKNKTITDIALESGFYDASQMNKYMYQMFGIAPLKLRQNSDLIQFLEPEYR